MNTLIAAGVVFGQETVDRFRDMGSGLRGDAAKVDKTELLLLGVVLLIVVVALVLLARVLAKQDRRAKYNSPPALFRSLCQAHELGRAERGLLKQMAHERKLAHPAQVFLEPSWFESANLSPGLRGRAPQLAAVAQRIFAEPPIDAALEKEAAAFDELIDA